MIRTVLLVATLTMLPAAPPVLAQPAPWFPPPPPEFRLDEGPDKTDTTHTFNYDTLGWVEITGQGWRASYVPRADAGRAPMDVLRHYRDQINLRGGRRLLSLVGTGEDGRVSGGQMAAHFPGTPSLWLQVHVGSEQIEVTVITEQRSQPVQLPVPPERTAGRWTPDAPVPTSVPAADRSAVAGTLALLSRFFRDAAPVKSPMGFDATVLVEPSPEAGAISPAGTRGIEFRLWLPETFQACDTCPAQHANEAGASIRVRINDLSRVLTAVVDDVNGQPLYEVAGTLEPTGTIARMRGGTLVMVRQGPTPIWTPVTRKDYLEAQIKDTTARAAEGDRGIAAGLKDQEAAIKELERTNPAIAREVRAQMAEALKQLPKTGGENPAVAMLTRELASLSDAEKAEPASGGNGARIVRLNAAYANRALPPATPQVIVVEFDRNQYFYYRDIVERMKDVDWAPVAALVR